MTYETPLHNCVVKMSKMFKLTLLMYFLENYVIEYDKIFYENVEEMDYFGANNFPLPYVSKET